MVVDVQFPIAADGRTRLQDAPDLLAVQPARPDGTPDTSREPVLVPFVRVWLAGVDLPAKRILMQLPSGLLDTETETSGTQIPDTLKAG